MTTMSWYRSTGATSPYGNLEAAHPGVAMEGYFWRFTLPGRTVIALCGINQSPGGRWATIAVATSDGFLTVADPERTGFARADPRRLGVTVGTVFRATPSRVSVRLPAAEIDVNLTGLVSWPRRRFGGSSYFQSIPHLNQYWHPWLLGGTATGTATLAGERFKLDGALCYGEKNWGREGFPDSWWWGQASFSATTCIAFAGGEVTAGPLRTKVTGLVVRVGDRLLRLGNPATSPVAARVSDDTWDLDGYGSGYRIRIHGDAPLAAAHILPVPLPSERRNTPGALEHLAAHLTVDVSRRGSTLWAAETYLGALEHGGLARAEAELRRRIGSVDV